MSSSIGSYAWRKVIFVIVVMLAHDMHVLAAKTILLTVPSSVVKLPSLPSIHWALDSSTCFIGGRVCAIGRSALLQIFTGDPRVTEHVRSVLVCMFEAHASSTTEVAHSESFWRRPKQQ
eukprot:5040109-Amphidinium_carterae.1